MSDEAPPPFWPKFGPAQFTPRACREPSPGLASRREGKADRKAVERARGLPCSLCGSTAAASTIPPESWAICPACYAVAPDKRPLAASHARPSLKYDRRKPRPPARAETWHSPWLTKAEAEALEREARAAGGELAAAVGSFLGSRRDGLTATA